MLVRTLNPSHINQLKEIHEKYYANEFKFPNFFDEYLTSPFVILNDEDKIIVAAGVREIAESIVVTNKDCSVRDRREALLKVLGISARIASASKYDQIHAFIQDDIWVKHLKRVGFKETVGRSVVLNIGG